MSELRKFYKKAETGALDGGFCVLLDGRKLKTPAKNDLILQTQESAQLIANEWAAQGELINSHSMPITRLINVAIDQTPPKRELIIEEICKYASSDLLCYKTSAPSQIFKNQCDLWDKEIEWFKSRFDILFIQKTDSLELFQTNTTIAGVSRLAENLDDLRLTILAHLTAICGSVILGFAMLEQHISAQEVFKLIRIEEDYNASIWGYDDEDLAKAEGKKTELLAMEKLIQSLKK